MRLPDLFCLLETTPFMPKTHPGSLILLRLWETELVWRQVVGLPPSVKSIGAVEAIIRREFNENERLINGQTSTKGIWSFESDEYETNYLAWDLAVPDACRALINEVRDEPELRESCPLAVLVASDWSREGQEHLVGDDSPENER